MLICVETLVSCPAPRSAPQSPVVSPISVSDAPLPDMVIVWCVLVTEPLEQMKAPAVPAPVLIVVVVMTAYPVVATKSVL